MACIAKRRNRYVIDFYDGQGQRRWKTLPEGTTKAKAKEAMREIEDQLARGVYLPDKKIPLFSEVAKDWIEYKKPNIRASTLKGYKGYFKNQFKTLKDIKINRITIAHVEKLISDNQGQGMNIKTIRRSIVVLGQVMQYAVRHRYIDYNPVRDAERPKGQGDEEKDDIRILAPGEISAFLDAEPDLKYKTLFRLAIFSGARQGELLGLKWTDIDWINSQIHIQRTFNNGAWYKPKSKASKRKIDLGPVTMAELKRWKLACPPNDLDLVFPDQSGQPIDHRRLPSGHYWPALKKAGIPKTKFHNLRHTFASLLIEQGENIKYIQTQLGHSNPTVTLDIYAHLMRPYNQASARKLENTIFGTTGSNLVAEKGKKKTAKNVTP